MPSCSVSVGGLVSLVKSGENLRVVRLASTSRDPATSPCTMSRDGAAVD